MNEALKTVVRAFAWGVGARGDQIQFAKLYGSNKADYLYVHDDSSVEAWNNQGAMPNGWSWYFLGTIAYGVGAPGDHIRFADMDGDGKADYLYVHENSAVELWLYRP